MVHVSIKSNLMYIAEMWADHGIVKIKTVDDKIKALTVQEAASRIRELNRLLIQSKKLNIQTHLIPHREELVHKGIEVIQAAKHQQEAPDKETERMQNMINGKTLEGKPVEEEASVQENIDYFRKQYPFLTEKEVGDVFIKPKKSYQEKAQEVHQIAEKKSREMAEAMEIKEDPEKAKG